MMGISTTETATFMHLQLHARIITLPMIYTTRMTRAKKFLQPK